jgi:hypothetical protein
MHCHSRAAKKKLQRLCLADWDAPLSLTARRQDRDRLFCRVHADCRVTCLMLCTGISEHITFTAEGPCGQLFDPDTVSDISCTRLSHCLSDWRGNGEIILGLKHEVQRDRSTSSSKILQPEHFGLRSAGPSWQLCTFLACT